MGESFLGFPNRFKIVGSKPLNFWNQVTGTLQTELDTTYNPNHALSAYYGYRLSIEYLNRTGGTEFAMLGDLYTQNIHPDRNYNFRYGKEPTVIIGSESNKYKAVYANEFHGTADIAKKLEHKVNLSITGAVTGKGTIDGSEATVTIQTTINHNHDSSYLKLTGGIMTGSITFNGVSTGINNSKGEQLLGYSPSGDSLNIGKGMYDGGHGSTDIYSNGKLNLYLSPYESTSRILIHNGISGKMPPYTLYKNIQMSFISGATYFLIGTASRGLAVNLSSGKLYYRDWSGSAWDYYEIFHRGNLDPKDGLSDYLKLTGGTMTGQIQRTGVASSWYNGRDRAMIRQTTSPGYNPILSSKTTNGSWDFGSYTNNTMYLSYITDTNYNKNTNTATAQFVFKPDGTLTAPTFSGKFIGSATFNNDVTIDHGKGIKFIDGNNRTALKIWCGNDGDGLENRYLHMSVQGSDGDVKTKCFAHFDRAFGLFNSRVPFRADHSVLGILRYPETASKCSVVASGTDANGNPIPPYYEYNLGVGVQINSAKNAFVPTTSGKLTLGNTSHKWGQIYSTKSAISTSDRNLKERIRKIPDVFEKVYADLLPVVYYWKSSEDTGYSHDRQHAGFISQDVEMALLNNGLTPMDFGGVCIDTRYPLKKNPFYGASQEEIVKYIKNHPESVDEKTRIIDSSDPYLDEEDISAEKITQYALRHEEIIPLNTYMIQKLMARVDRLEILAGLKDELDYPELIDPNRYGLYDDLEERDD